MDLLKGVLKTGYQRQRIAAALELAIHQPGTPLFETRAPGFVQQRLLGKGVGVLPFDEPFDRLRTCSG